MSVLRPLMVQLLFSNYYGGPLSSNHKTFLYLDILTSSTCCARDYCLPPDNLSLFSTVNSFGGNRSEVYKSLLTWPMAKLSGPTSKII